MLIDLLPYLLFFSRIGLVIVFTESSVGKLHSLSTFEQAIANLEIIPRKYIRMIAYLIILGEIAAASLLIIGGSFLMIGFWLANFFFLVFSLVLISVIARGIQTPCNCFGSSQRLVSIQDVWRNLGFILYALMGIASLTRLDGVKVTLNLFELSLLGLGAIGFVVLWTHLGEFFDIFSIH